MQKRGLSTVVTTLILIVISLVAIGAVWVVVNNLLKGQSDQIALDRITFDAEITQVALYNSSNNLSVSVQRNVGEANLKGIKYYFYNQTSAEVITEYFTLGELGQKTFSFNLAMDLSSLEKISIVPIFNSKDGKDAMGNVADSYNVKQGVHINTENNQTCTPAIYTYSCSGKINFRLDDCGVYQNITCSSSEICVANSTRCMVACTPLTYTYSCSGNKSIRLDNCGATQNVTCTTGQTCFANSTRCGVGTCAPTNYTYTCSGNKSIRQDNCGTYYQNVTCNATQICLTNSTRCGISTCTPLTYTYSCSGNKSIRLDNCGATQNVTCNATQICLTNSTRCRINTTTCAPTTCAARGYTCGSWANGTCAGTLNCGSCTTGYSCNSSGRCIAVSSNVHAEIDVFTTSGLAPFTVQFNAFDSSSTSGEIVDYYWDFHDSNSQYARYDTGRMVGHRFDNAGTYTVDLTVKDGNGNTNTNSITITALSRPGTARIYYVASSADGGDDSNTGLCSTDEGTCGPWATFGKVISSAAGMPDGSQILFNRGDTFSLSINDPELGTASIEDLMRAAPYYIKLGAYGTGVIPTFSAGLSTGYATENQGFILEDIHLQGSLRLAPTYYGSSPSGFRYPGHQISARNCIFDDGFGGWDGSGLTYENIQTSGGENTGDDIQRFAEFIYWNNVTVKNSPGHGVYFAVETIGSNIAQFNNFLVENSEFANNGLGANLRDGFTLHGRINNFIFRNNNIHDNGYGLGWNTGYPTYELMSNFILEDCRIHDQVYYTTQFSALQNFTIRNNLFYNNPSGVLNFWESAGDADTSNVRIYNNVFYNNNEGYQDSIIDLEQNIDNVYIYNNIFVNNNGMTYVIRDAGANDLTISNNLYYNNNPAANDFILNGVGYNLASWISSGREPGIVNANPLFVNAGSFDFRLQSGSPAINAGIKVPSLLDRAGNTRPSGSAWDIGAYEYS
jgi:hypothetical protein